MRSISNERKEPDIKVYLQKSVRSPRKAASTKRSDNRRDNHFSQTQTALATISDMSLPELAQPLNKLLKANIKQRGK